MIDVQQWADDYVHAVLDGQVRMTLGAFSDWVITRMAREWAEGAVRIINWLMVCDECGCQNGIELCEGKCGCHEITDDIATHLIKEDECEQSKRA